MAAEPSAGGRSGCLAVVLVVLVVGPLLLLFGHLIPRHLADLSVAGDCRREGGIRVHEHVQLKPGRFASSPDVLAGGDRGRRRLFDDFVIAGSTTSTSHFGVTVDRHTTRIVRTSDGKILSEMILYFRGGDEVFHGRHCPGGITERDLIDQTFLAPSGLGSRNPGTCANRYATQTITVDLTHYSNTGTRGNLDTPWWRAGRSAPHSGCAGRTEIQPHYEQVAPGETQLTATSLLFDPPSGERCRAFAMASPDRIVCSEHDIRLFGRKTISHGDDLMIQRYSRDGTLVSETVLIGTGRHSRARIVGVREDAQRVSVEFLDPGQDPDHWPCRRTVVEKPVAAANAPVTQPHLAEFVADWLPGCPAR